MVSSEITSLNTACAARHSALQLFKMESTLTYFGFLFCFVFSFLLTVKICLNQ